MMYMMGTPGIWKGTQGLSHGRRRGSACLSYASPQIPIARGHDVALVLGDSVADAVVRVDPSVRARQSTDVRMLQPQKAGRTPSPRARRAGHLRDLQPHSVLGSQRLQLAHHAVRYVQLAVGVQAVPGASEEVDLPSSLAGMSRAHPTETDLVLDGEVDEVGVDDDVVGRSQLRVVPKVHRRRRLGPEQAARVRAATRRRGSGLTLVARSRRAPSALRWSSPCAARSEASVGWRPHSLRRGIAMRFVSAYLSLSLFLPIFLANDGSYSTMSKSKNRRGVPIHHHLYVWPTAAHALRTPGIPIYDRQPANN